MRFLTLLIFTFVSVITLGQTPADWWYFGTNAGIHFETGGPVSVSNGQLSTSEGCASLSDVNGDLLFYTDGIKVYDRNHIQMTNGLGLLGNPSSTHSAIIVPKPSNPNHFYIFTVDASGTNGVGMYYTTVDMTLNSGDGDVVTTEKNVFLVDDTSEKVTALKKSNGYWVVTHLAETNQYYAYEVTSAGVNTTPVVSTTLWPTSGFGFGITSTAVGNRIASVYHTTDSVHLYKMNMATGVITSDLKIGSSLSLGVMYGLEFSPNGDLLYLQSYNSGDVRQFDLTLGTSAAISASETIIGSGSGGGQLQLGPDGRIYCARVSTARLSAIPDPNVVGTGCGWIDTAVVLSSNCVYGLPTFIQSFFSVSFSQSKTCIGDTTFFTMDTANVDSVIWNFGDPGSGVLNTSNELNTSHFYNDTGIFDIQLIAYSDTLVDTSFNQIRIYPRQSIDLGNDTLVCIGTALEFSAAQTYASFLWHDSTTADTFLTQVDTLVSVTVFGVCDTVSDRVRITYDDTIHFDLGPDTTLCGGTFYFLNADINVNANLLWSTGDSLDTLSITESGNYFLHADNACGLVMDTVEIIFLPIPSAILLPADTINCFDNEIVLRHPDVEGTTYIWSDSSSKKTYRVDTTETVWLASFNVCGSTLDTMHLIFNKEIESELGNDTTICDLDTIVLKAFSPGATYLWSTGDTIDSILTGQQSELYVVTVSQGLCQTIESKQVDLANVLCPGIDCALKVSNVFTPNDDGVNDIWRVTSDCDIQSFGLNVYNRWGQLIHHSDNAKFGWDGTVYGEPASEGVYYYELVFKDTVIVAVDNLDFRGSITIMR